jgi:hypothetical protein
VSLWKLLEDERLARKWPSWSAHFAWGIVIVWAVAHRMPLGVGLVVSAAVGAGWEIIPALIWQDKSWRASALDLVPWLLGACAATVAAIWA